MSHMQMGGSNQAGGFLMGLASGTSMNPQFVADADADV